MDFRGRSNQSSQPAPSVPTVNQGSTSGAFTSSASRASKNVSNSSGGLLKIASVVLLFSVTALVIGLTFLLVFGIGSGQQEKAILKSQYQAVFLNNGQVYFGNIASIGSKTFDLRNIYYLQTSGTAGTSAAASNASNVSLVKLGCELHAPYDQMFINSDQVIFWENIKQTGQVVKAIQAYQTAHTTQTCSTASQSSTQQAPSTTPPAATTVPGTSSTKP